MRLNYSAVKNKPQILLAKIVKNYLTTKTDILVIPVGKMIADRATVLQIAECMSIDKKTGNCIKCSLLKNMFDYNSYSDSILLLRRSAFIMDNPYNKRVGYAAV